MLRKPPDGVVFIENKIENEFLFLSEGHIIRKAIERVIANLRENIFYGRNIPKKQIPKEYIQKYNIDNLWWTPLPDGWRLVYAILTNKEEVIVAIVEFFDHKNYERRFGY